MDIDIVVLGATGFTGKLVVDCLANVSENVRWLITGRSKQKICDLVDSMKVKGLDISQIPTRIVDMNNKESLDSVLQHAKLVLNCIGPNTTFSGPIVEACIRSGTHYIDMSAEINQILKLYLEYHKAAEEANVLIIPSCGYASLIPASGLLHLEAYFQGTLNSVECYSELHIPKVAYIPFKDSLASYGTWDSMVHVLRNLKEYKRLKAETFPEIELPKDIKRNFFHWRRRKLWYPYPGPDENVIEMSERYLQEKRLKNLVHFKLYTTMPLFIHYLIIPFIFLYFYLSYFHCFAKLLWKYPRLFTVGYMSHKGPSEKMRDATKYSFSYIGKGWGNEDDHSKPPSKVMEVKVSSKDPYNTTAFCMVIAALTILKEQSRMPSGGVVNVGAAFYGTTLVENLMQSGITYEVI